MAENETQKCNKNLLLLKKTLQLLLVSISVLSLFISCPSDVSRLLHYYYGQVSATLCPVLSQTLERKYIFLICNGIVAFLAKSFRLTSYSPSGPFTTDTLVKSYGHGNGMMPLCQKGAILERKETAMGSKSRGMIKKIEDDDADDGRVGTRYLVPSFPEQAGGNEANMSTDELNKKFDEFIRKMKEEIRIGAQRQPIGA